MAQIAGIDFPWKTTTAIQRGLKEMSEHEQLEDGDLIWMPGHVIIISNSAANELIEARGYTSGFGAVHRATLSECFENISTYDDLRKAALEGKPLKLKDKNGNVLGKEYKIKILKLVA